jgi:hypothetical protein
MLCAGAWFRVEASSLHMALPPTLWAKLRRATGRHGRDPRIHSVLSMVHHIATGSPCRRHAPYGMHADKVNHNECRVQPAATHDAGASAMGQVDSDDRAQEGR